MLWAPPKSDGAQTTSSQMVSTTLMLVPKNSQKNHVTISDHRPSQWDGRLIRPQAIPKKLGIASLGPMESSSLSLTTLVTFGLVVLASTDMVRRTKGRGGGELGFIFMREGRWVWFVCCDFFDFGLKWWFLVRRDPFSVPVLMKNKNYFVSKKNSFWNTFGKVFQKEHFW